MRFLSHCVDVGEDFEVGENGRLRFKDLIRRYLNLVARLEFLKY